MKLLGLLFLAISASCAECAWYDFISDNMVLDESEKLKVQKYAEDCLQETQADPALFERLRNNEFPENRELKCFFPCFAKKFKTLNDDGQYELAKLRPKLSERQYEAVSKCSTISQNDLCDQLYETHKCYIRELGK